MGFKNVPPPEGYVHFSVWATKNGVSGKTAYSWAHARKIASVMRGRYMFVKEDAPMPAKGKDWGRGTLQAAACAVIVTAFVACPAHAEAAVIPSVELLPKAASSASPAQTASTSTPASNPTQTPIVVQLKPEAKEPSFKEKHPLAYKLSAPVRFVWKPVKYASDKTGLTKVVVLVDDGAKWASKKCEPYTGLMSATSSAAGLGINSGALLTK